MIDTLPTPSEIAKATRKELLIGCGARRDKLLSPVGYSDWEGLVTLDMNAAHAPDKVWDLNQLPYPFPDNEFDEVHAYDVLEHLGSQGDWKAFFDDFMEIWRILKPGGYLCATVPAHDSPWAWGDPSHRRIINAGTLAFLSQDEYAKQVGKSPMSDFRFYYKADFKPVYVNKAGEVLQFILRAMKPEGEPR